MAHNTRTRVNQAAWANGTQVSQDEFDKLDQKGYTAINGDDGGTWAPASVIAIGGAGIELVNSPLVLSGTASCTVAGAASFTGTFSATGATLTLGNNSTSTLALRAITTATKLVVCQGGFVSEGATTIGDSSSDTCTVNAALTVVNDCTIGEDSTDDAYFNSTEHHTGPEFHEGAEEHIGTELHDGAETHNGDETHSGQEWHYGVCDFEAAVSLKRAVTLGSTTSDILTLNSRIKLGASLITFVSNAASYDGLAPNRLIASGDPGVVSTVTFTSANTTEGLVKRVSYNHTSTTGAGIVVKDGVTGNTLATLAPQTACEVTFTGGRWYLS